MQITFCGYPPPSRSTPKWFLFLLSPKQEEKVTQRCWASGVQSDDAFFLPHERDAWAEPGLCFSFASSLRLFPNGLALSPDSRLISAWPWAGRFLKFCCLSKQNRTFHPNLNRTIYNIYNSITYRFSCLAFIWGKALSDMRELVLEN